MTTKLKVLVEILERLRGELGCPWDRQQTRESIKPYLLEEACEAMDAIESGDASQIRDELGDILLQIVFQSQIARERREFDIEEVIQSCIDKMIRRHPHVFGDQPVKNATEVLQRWEDLKRQERGDTAKESLLDGIPRTLPTLHQARKVQERASREGFDWPAPSPDCTSLGGEPGVREVMEKVREEVDELEEVLQNAGKEQVEAELGDLLFSVVNLSRLTGIDAEAALRGAVSRFARRFAEMQRTARRHGKRLRELDPEQMNQLWEQAKRGD